MFSTAPLFVHVLECVLAVHVQLIQQLCSFSDHCSRSLHSVVMLANARPHDDHPACMQFFEKYAAEPSCMDATVASDPHAYVRSSDAQFSPHRANATSAAVTFMHARFHPLATCMAAGRESRGHASGVSTGGLPGMQLFLTSTSLLFSPEGFDSPRGVTHLAQQQLETGLGIQVLPTN